MPRARTLNKMHVRDGVCLSTACCTVCEDGRIVSLQHAVEERFCCGLVHIALHGIFVEYAVERKRLVLDTLSLGYDGAGEALNGIVLGRVEHSEVMLARLWLEGRVGAWGSVQALVVHDLDDGAEALGMQLGGGCCCQRSVAEKECLVVAFRQLSRLSDGEGAHPHGDGNGRRAIGGHGRALGECIAVC